MPDQGTETRDTPSLRWLRGAALAIGAVAVALALLAQPLVAMIENIDAGGFPLFNAEVAATPSFMRFFWAYTLLGGVAVAMAIAAYLGGGLGRSGRVALLLGIVALAWKYVVYAIIIAVVIAVLLNFGS